MQLNITGHHIDITDALRDYVTTKFDKLQRHFDQVTNGHVVLSVEKLIQKAEATLHISGADVYADATHEDMYAAIDALIDKLGRQLKKYRGKQNDHHRADGGLKNKSVESL